MKETIKEVKTKMLKEKIMRVEIDTNVPLSRHTTFRIGGPADMFIRVRSLCKLIQVVEFAIKKSIPFLILGGGSNILVCDRGIRGLVIKNEIRGIRRRGNILIVRSGEKLSNLVSYAQKCGLSGLEFASGIPGTVGGAVYGNAGAYGEAIGDKIVSARILKIAPSDSIPPKTIPAVTTKIEADSMTTEQFNPASPRILTVSPDYFQFSYRWSKLKETKDVLIEVTIALIPGDPSDIFQKMEKIIAERKSKHPSKEWGCAGSYFKNIAPSEPGARRIPAGLLLEQVGAKGMKEGCAMVFPGHANFLTNPGGATCEDVLRLASILKEKVRQKFCVELEEEVIYIDEYIESYYGQSQNPDSSH